jgi:hypothetical protein
MEDFFYTLSDRQFNSIKAAIIAQERLGAAAQNEPGIEIGDEDSDNEDYEVEEEEEESSSEEEEEEEELSSEEEGDDEEGDDEDDRRRIAWLFLEKESSATRDRQYRRSIPGCFRSERTDHRSNRGC